MFLTIITRDEKVYEIILDTLLVYIRQRIFFKIKN